ncbi:MerR family transcriptional regulator [Qiania dongpingensis]|uniref:MerR family transcriptional regulator n=1 Tax=Qiania dongpingensis TaxID=2763669 RepID=A0A7G9G3H5_9FIRM|nr:MerR family transcriptional regulator [Qiania dongpingensis]QNM05357.1 MerR family transcriptional regulator [Qiania dongpingensis]
MEHNRYFTAGEFARIAGTTKYTLFHYDDIGLFCPALRADNGYRYYSIEQLEIFDVICILRELDMPLSQIQDYLAHKSPEAFRKLLADEEALVSQKIARLKRTRDWLRAKAALLQKSLEKESASLEILEFPEQYYVSTYTAVTEDTAVAQKIAALYDHCEKHGFKSPYNVGYIQKYSSLSRGVYQDYHIFYLLFDTPPKKLAYTVKPAGRYLCAYHKGHWNRIDETYQKLLQYVSSNSEALSEDFFEDYLLDELAVSGAENYLTRISVRLESPPL